MRLEPTSARALLRNERRGESRMYICGEAAAVIDRSLLRTLDDLPKAETRETRWLGGRLLRAAGLQG